MDNISYHDLESCLHDTESMLKKSNMQLALWWHISHLLHSTLDVNKILSVILTLVTAGPGLGFNRAILMLKDEENKGLEGILGVGPYNLEEAYEIWSRLQDKSLEEIINDCKNIVNYRELNDIVKQLKFPLTSEGGILAKAVIENKPFNVNPNSINSDVDKNIANILKCDAFVVVPLRTTTEVIGVIIADNLFTRRPITGEDIQLLSILANHAAIAIENARLYQRLAKQLSEIKQMQDRLLQMERHLASGELSAAIAHEIKNPLIAIGGFARRLRRKMEPIDPNWETVGIIVEEVGRMERLLKQLRSFSQTAQTGDEACDVNRIIQKILTLVKDGLEGDIKLETNFTAGLPQVLISEDEIKQVFLNLIQNSLQAMPNGGYLKIDSFYDGNAVIIQVKDNGMGISAALKENMFQPFFTTKEDGSGLGLALSSQIIKAHGGTIEIKESEHGKGTTFSICLPVG